MGPGQAVPIDTNIDTPANINIEDKGVGLRAWIAIDTLIAGRSCGGLRLIQGITPEEMAGLARAMTLKHGFLGIPHGGSKAGIVCPEELDAGGKLKLLEAFAKRARGLLMSGIFSPGADMGTNNNDVRAMLNFAGVRLSKRALKSEDSGLYTAMTVLSAAVTAARHIGMKLKGCTAAIEGFGSVGRPLAERLATEGVRIVAVSTSRGALYSKKGLDVAELVRAARERGSAFVDSFRGAKLIERSELLTLPVDLLLPCARHDSVNAGNAERVKAALICPGSNNPVTKEALSSLYGRGVLCVPDFVSNSGGVLGGTMEFASIKDPAIEGFINTVFSREVSGILNASVEAGVSPTEYAEALAMERFYRIKTAAEKRTPMAKAFGLVLELYRRGFVPGFFMSGPSYRYFERRIEGRL